MAKGTLPAGEDWPALRRQFAGEALVRALAFCGCAAAGTARRGSKGVLLLTGGGRTRELAVGPVNLLWQGAPLTAQAPDWPRRMDSDTARFLLTGRPLAEAVDLDFDLAVRRDPANPYYRALRVHGRLCALLSRQCPPSPAPALPARSRALALAVERFPAAVRRTARELDPFYMNRYAAALTAEADRFLRAGPLTGETRPLARAAEIALANALGILNCGCPAEGRREP